MRKRLHLSCPKDPTHKRFTANARVVEAWVCDEHGDWLETAASLDVVDRPGEGDEWNCFECDTPAIQEIRECHPEPPKPEGQQMIVEKDPNPNTNCLEGMQCPECGSYGPFVLAIQTWMEFDDDGEDPFDTGGDREWDDDSGCVCSSCKHRGKVRDFKD